VDDPRRHALEHRIRFDECGADGLLRSGGYLRVMQDLAWQHSERLGLGRDWYREHRVAWLVRFADLRIVGAARSGDALRVTTTVTGWRRVWARRESTASVDGTEVARATIDWVLVDGSGRPARVPQVVMGRLADGLPTFQPGRLPLPPTPDDAARWRWQVSIRDLDPMRHVNNATYLDVLDEALAAGSDRLAGGPPPIRHEMEYLRPALPGQAVAVEHWVVDGATDARFVDPAGHEVVRARVTEG